MSKADARKYSGWAVSPPKPAPEAGVQIIEQPKPKKKPASSATGAGAGE